MGRYLLGSLHITKLRATAEECYITVVDVDSDITFNGVSIVSTTSEEIIDVGIIDLPTNVATDRLLRGSCCFMEVSTADIAFGIVGSFSSILIVGSREVKTREFSSCYRYWYMGRGPATVTVGAHSKLIDPNVAAHMDIDNLSIDFG